MKRKRIVSMFMVMLLLLGSFSWSFGNEIPEVDKEQYFQKLREHRREKIEAINPLEKRGDEAFPGENSKQFKPDEKVRVIVELHGGPSSYSLKRAGGIQAAMDEQERIIEDVQQKIDLEKRHQFVESFYGFSAETEYQNIDDLENHRQVKAVYIAERFTLDMTNSRKIVNTQELVDLEGLMGDGMVIAILDSGVDPDHADWEMLDEDQVKITRNRFNQLAHQTAVAEIYYNSKIPTGYDWADQDTDVKGYASDHGIHVAGTAAGNGKIQGIAPNAQILAEKVFSDYDEYAYEDDIVAGIHHAVEFEADVINMSLGSTAAFLDPERPYHKAITYAVDKGVVVAVSAGNSAYSSSWSYGAPYRENPDVGLVGSPGLWYDTIQVASHENDIVTSYYMEYGDHQRALYSNSGPNVIFALNQKYVEILDAGLGGTESDFAGKDFTGKIALIERGQYSFVEKIENAEAHGAIGVIIFNSEAGKDELINMAYPDNGTIPAVFIGRTAGMALKNLLKGGPTSVRFAETFGEEVNGNRGKMATSTSWGLTSDLAFKPEITAPGGNIWSLSNDDLYGNKSGTSMASPHVAGGAALIMQYLTKTLGLPKDRDTVELAKLLLMNTATIVEDPDNKHLPYSPRRQGAGMMKLDLAASTPAYVYTEIKDDDRLDDYDRKNGAVTLRDDVEAPFQLHLATIDEKAMTVGYAVYTSIYTDHYNSKDELTMKTMPVVGGKVNLIDISTVDDEDLTVTDVVYAEPGKINTLTFQIDLSDADVESESFIEGFIQLVPLDSSYPTLSVPFVGFYGDWNTPKTIDPAFWEGDTFTEYTGLYDSNMLNYLNYLGVATNTAIDNYKHLIGLGFNMNGDFNPNRIAISPFSGYKEEAQAVYTLLRNAREFKLEIVDGNNQVVKTLFDNKTFRNPDGTYPFAEGLRKNVLASSPLTQYAALFSWDGTDAQGNMVPEGQYYFRVSTKIHYDHIRPVAVQRYSMPVKVDVTPLEIKNLTLEGETLKWEINDQDLYGFAIYVNGSLVAETMDTQVTIPGVTPDDFIVVIAEDIAGNLSLSYTGNHENEDLGVITSAKVEGQGELNLVNYQNPAKLTAQAAFPVHWNVKILDPNGAEVGKYQVVSDDVFTANWQPLNRYQPSGNYRAIFEAQYTLVDENGAPFNNVERKEVQFPVYNYEVLVDGLEILDAQNLTKDTFAADETVQVKVTVKDLGPASVSPTIIVKVTDSQDRVVSTGLAVVSLEELKNQETATVRTFIQMPKQAAKGTYSVKAYVWNGWTGEAVEPLSTTVEGSFIVQ